MISVRLAKNAKNLSKVVILLDSVNMIHAKLLFGSSCFFLALPVHTTFNDLEHTLRLHVREADIPPPPAPPAPNLSL